MKISRMMSRFSLAVLALSALPLNTIFAATPTTALPDGTGNSFNTDSKDASGSAYITNSGNSGSGTSKFGVGFIPGALTLDQVPNFDFGIHALGEAGTVALPPSMDGTAATGLSAFPMIATTVANTDSGSRSLVVTDQTGSTSGWSVNVSVTTPLTRTQNLSTSGSATDAADADKIPLTSALLAFNVLGYTAASGATPAVSGDATIGTYASGKFSAFGGTENKNPALTVTRGAKGGTGTSAYQPAVVLDVGSENKGTKNANLFSVGAGSNGNPLVAPGSYQLDFTPVNNALLYVAPTYQKKGIFNGVLTWTLKQGIQ